MLQVAIKGDLNGYIRLRVRSEIGRKIEPPDWVDDSKHLIDRNELKHHTNDYIRQLLTATFEEFQRRNIEDRERWEWVRKFSEKENDWGMI